MEHPEIGDITKQQTNTESLMQKQDGDIGMTEFTTGKQTMISEGVATVAVIDECQQKTGVLATVNKDAIFDAPAGYFEEGQATSFPSLGCQHTTLSGTSQHAMMGNWVTEKRTEREERVNLDKPGSRVDEPDCRSRDLARVKGYDKYKAIEKHNKVSRYRYNYYSKPVLICMAIFFVIISTACMVNIWILQSRMNRLEDLMRQNQNGLYLEDHTTWMEKDRLDEDKDKTIYHDDFKHLSGTLDLQHVTPSDVIKLSRRVRRADDPAPADGKSGKSRSNSKENQKGNKKRKKKGKGKNLQVELYIGEWSKDYNPATGKCGKHHKLPGKPHTCLTQSIVYRDEGSIVAFFQKDESWTPVKKNKKKKKHVKHTPLLEENSKGQFVVKTTGTFLLHFNMTLNDKTQNKSVGLFLNGGILFACPPGGLRCPLTNEKDTSHFRLCTAHGVAKLQINDVVDIRTMDKDMTIKVKLPSLFWAILLARHPLS